MLSDKLEEVRERKWNMERLLYFMSVALHTPPNIKGAVHIKHRIKQRLVEWDKEKN